MTTSGSESKRAAKPFLAVVRELALHLVAEQQPAHVPQSAAIRSIAAKSG